jgi:hypothetical protein
MIVGFVKYYMGKALGIKRPYVYRPSLNPMRRVRKLVYRMGFRPKLGSIFFSPSQAFYLNAREGFMKGIANLNCHGKARK